MTRVTIYDVPCAFCGAGPGEDCRSGSGQRSRAHRVRWDAVQALRLEWSAAKPRCPVHGQTDCSPLLNGCTRLTAPNAVSEGDGR